MPSKDGSLKTNETMSAHFVQGDGKGVALQDGSPRNINLLFVMPGFTGAVQSDRDFLWCASFA
jgi:hypothetical protein